MRAPKARNRGRRTRRRPAVATASALEILESRLLLSTVDVAPIDGVGNNIDNPEWGSVDVQLLRLASESYADGISEPAGAFRPSAREVSNVVVAQDESTPNDRYLTDFVWLWGQFVDHDIDLTEAAMPEEPFPIDVPQGDPYFDPDGTGTATIDLNRSTYDPDTGSGAGNPREQINQITAFIDGSMVYGSDEIRAAALRVGQDGKLKTSTGNLLPFNLDGLPNAGGTEADLFLAGDVRANENAALSAMHTLFVREHNRLADEIAAADPTLSDDDIYDQARGIVTAEIQAITYNEFLPALIGTDAVGGYTGYDPTVNPGISNIFSTAAYRLGHSLLSSDLLRLDDSGQVIDAGNLSLRDAFFAPQQLIDNGIDSLFRGLAAQKAQEVDTMIVDDVRNFLFGPPGSGGFDLASLNIQRGRDHGLPDYNQARVDLGLAPVASFADITSNVSLQAKLEQVYENVNDIDVWVGGLAEDHIPGSSVGELIHTVLVDQFQRLRSGDRFWYQNVFMGDQLIELENTTLADVIQRNTEISDLRDNVFMADSVLYYKAPVGDGPVEIAMRSSGSTVEIVDRNTGAVLASGHSDEIEQVMVFGSDYSDESFFIDLNGRWSSMPGGVVLHGGWQDHDEWVIDGTWSGETIAIGTQDVRAHGATMSYSGIEMVTVNAGHGNDRVYADGNVLASLVMNGGSGNDILVGSNHSDRINGNAGNDWIFGRGGNDMLYGGPGHDVVFGGTGDDHLAGGSGRDILIGGNGDDSYDHRWNDHILDAFSHGNANPPARPKMRSIPGFNPAPVNWDLLSLPSSVLKHVQNVFEAKDAADDGPGDEHDRFGGQQHTDRGAFDFRDGFFARASLSNHLIHF